MRAASSLLGNQSCLGDEAQLFLYFTCFKVCSDSSKLINSNLGGALTIVPTDVTPPLQTAVNGGAL